MRTFRVANVDDEEALLTLLDSLARTHSVKARYVQPCLPRTYQICIDGQHEEKFESDLHAFASYAGWLIRD